MRLAVFSDVHGNYINLQSFFKVAENFFIDKFICLGDMCNYYPENKKVIKFLKEKGITCLLGNHDQYYISEDKLTIQKKNAYNFDETLEKSSEEISYLKSLPLYYEMFENGKSILFCHASPSGSLLDYVYPDSDLDLYKDIRYNYVFMGHTHRQFLRTSRDTTFCNVGSIGLPRDNGSLMGFAILDTDTFEIKLYRKKIDTDFVKSYYSSQTTAAVIELMNRNESIAYPYILI